LATLLDAVPSFAPEWDTWRAGHDDYVAQFPDAELTEPETGDEFLAQLASHLARRIATGDTNEVSRVFGALEPMLEGADEATYNALTIGFLESLIYAVEREGAEAAPLGAFAVGRASHEAWSFAFRYTHGRTELPPDPTPT
jgi:hypothetical protein